MTSTPRWPDGRIPVLLSAHREDLIAADAAGILSYLERGPALDAVAGTLLRTRRVRRHRAVVRAADSTELSDGLSALAEGREHPLVARSSETQPPRLALVVPGQGNHWAGMGAEAYQRLTAYRAEADRCAEAFLAAGVATPLNYLLTGTEDASEPEIQGAQFTHAVALARVWRSCGILPDVTVGHSLGEVAAAYLAAVISLPDAVAVVTTRAEVVAGLPGRYGMAVLGVGEQRARELIAAAPGWAELSVVNSGSSVVVSGDRHAVAAITETLAAAGGFARIIPVDYPAHTRALEPLRGELAARLPRGVFADSPVQFIGSATGAVVAPGTPFADYWYRNLRNTVRFDRAVAAATLCGARAFVELSGHPALLAALDELIDGYRDMPDGPAVLVGSGQRDEPLPERLSANIAAAAVADPGYRWADMAVTGTQPLPDFPGAPMRATRLWASPEPLPQTPRPTVTVERWQEYAVTAGDAPRRRVAVIGIGDDGALARELRAAVDAHPGTIGAAARSADLLIAVAPAPIGPDIGAAVAALNDLIGAGGLGYADSIGPWCRDVWLLTAGGEQVTPADPPAEPMQAALAAMHRSVGFEHADQVFHHLDLPCGRLGGGVVDVLLGAAGECALRHTADGPVLFGRTLGGEAQTGPRWRLDCGLLDNVVITGGSGTIGLAYARYLADRGAARIVLLSRRGADPTAIAAVRSQGVDVVTPQCDITDPERVAATADAFAGDGASLLIHAAGTAAFATRGELTADAFADMAAAKLTGLTHLSERWPLRSDARILLCSSVIGVWGGKGVVGYAAANRMLDAMAGRLRARGLHCIAVRWGLWEGSDIVDAAEMARVERSGLRPMPPMPAIEASLRDHPHDPLVLSADADRLGLFFGSQRDAATAATDAGIGVAEAVRAELASVLTVTDGAALDLNSSLFDLGVDSLLALELRKRIKRAIGHTVPLATLLGGITGVELIAELEREFSRD